MNKLLLCLIASLSWSAASYAAEAPDPKSWLQELRNEDRFTSAKKGTYPSIVIFVSSFPKGKAPVLAAIDAKTFNGLGFLKTIDQSELNYILNLNLPPQTSDEEKKATVTKTRSQWIQFLLDAADADTVVYMNANKAWQVYQRAENNKVKLVLSLPKGSGSDAPSLHQWFVNSLGYEGVVIDRKDSYFLVGTLQNAQKEDTQALILKGTDMQFKVKKANKEGGGLMQLVSQYEGFGVFELLLGEQPETIVYGTKIVIERGGSSGSAPKATAAKAQPKKESAEPAAESEVDPKAAEAAEPAKDPKAADKAADKTTEKPAAKAAEKPAEGAEPTEEE